jgi:hypothetical protein
MASFVTDNAKEQILLGTWDFSSGTPDIRVALMMTNTTCDIEKDKATNAGYTTLDEFDGSGYSSGGVALTSEAVSEDGANNRAEFDAADVTFSSVGAGTRQIAGALLYAFVTNFNSSVPIAWIDTGGFPVTANGGDILISWNAEGILQAT